MYYYTYAQFLKLQYQCFNNWALNRIGEKNEDFCSDVVAGCCDSNLVRSYKKIIHCIIFFIIIYRYLCILFKYRIMIHWNLLLAKYQKGTFKCVNVTRRHNFIWRRFGQQNAISHHTYLNLIVIYNNIIFYYSIIH